MLIAGPTGSGKSALALRIAASQGGRIVNADALQVWSCWRVLTARPTAAEEAGVPHLLYGHLAPGAAWSAGHWLRALDGLLTEGGRLIVTGGTGLYFAALTSGFATVPPVPPEVRAAADARRAAEGAAALLAELDRGTAARIDPRNPARIQRAWEVLRATGRGLAEWQAETPPARLPTAAAVPLLVEAGRDWLADRIERRFDAMLVDGALAEVEAMLPCWDPSALWAKAIGAAELGAYLRGETSLTSAREAAITASRQYAKRQRTFFRGRLKGFHGIAPPESATR